MLDLSSFVAYNDYGFNYKSNKSYHKREKNQSANTKGGGYFEERQEADPKAKDQTRASWARPGELAGRETETKWRACHSP